MSLPARTVLARTAVPIAVAGLLLTGCGGGKPQPATSGISEIAPATAKPYGGGAIAGSGAAVDMAPGSGMAAGIAAPVNALTPLAAAAPTASVDGHLLATRGVGRASGTPDTVTVWVGVSTQAASARSALDANNGKANALIQLLRRNGVAEKDLRTNQLSINPVYNDRSSAITGYQVDNTVQATLRDLSKAGTLLDAAVGTVGNAVRIQQISFSIGDDTALRAQARAQAVAQAKAQAGQLAQAAGVTLGAVRSLTEVVDGGSPITYDMGKAAAGMSAASVPVQAGQQEITVAVDLVYDIS